MINVGTSGITAINYGQSGATNLYVGSTLAWSASTGPDYSKQYLTFKITQGGDINWLAESKISKYRRTISYSNDSGATWTQITSTTGGTTVSVNNGDVVLFKGTNSEYAVSNGYTECENTFSGTTCEFEVEGNIMSLLYGDNFTGQTTFVSANTFNSLFQGCTGLTKANNLVLPATTLTNKCYYRMFADCSSLTTAPELPATALTENCYNKMFACCSSLTTAPELPATTLAKSCYMYMFQDCTSLNYIKCLAETGINTDSSTSSWVDSVASAGTFVKKSGITWPSGANGIPRNWTVEEV